MVSHLEKNRDRHSASSPLHGGNGISVARLLLSPNHMFGCLETGESLLLVRKFPVPVFAVLHRWKPGVPYFIELGARTARI